VQTVRTAYGTGGHIQAGTVFLRQGEALLAEGIIGENAHAHNHNVRPVLQHEGDELAGGILARRLHCQIDLSQYLHDVVVDVVDIAGLLQALDEVEGKVLALVRYIDAIDLWHIVYGLGQH